jgi:translation initiation factor 1 (eIF-1/SUI1)
MNKNITVYDDLLNKDDLFNENKITIYTHNYYADKRITTLTGLPDFVNLQLFLHIFMSTYKCDGYIYNDKQSRDIIIIFGYHKDNMYNFIFKEGFCKKSDILLKGI